MRLVQLLTISIMTGCLAAYPANVHAQSETSNTALTYDIYAGGMHAMHAKLAMKDDPNVYDVQLEAETRGMIGKLFPWQATYEASGKTGTDTPIPSRYKSVSIWQKQPKETELVYDDSGKIIEKRIKGEKDKAIPPKLASDAVDILTAITQILDKTTAADDCNASIPAFDGKRRFNINFKKDGQDVIPASDYSVFSGPAMRCIVTVTPVAGFKDKDKNKGWMAVQNHSAALNKLPTIWLARVDAKDPDSRLVPVRMEVKSTYGGVVAHLTSLRKNDTLVASVK